LADVGSPRPSAKRLSALCLARHEKHTHATHALERGVDLTTVRDNLRHASVSTTSGYLHTDKEKRARQLGAAFSGSGRRPATSPSSEKNRV